MNRIPFSNAADHLGVSISTLKAWADRLQVGNDRGEKGKRFLSSDEVKMLEAAKALRDAGSGLDTMTRKLSTSRLLDDSFQQAAPGSYQADKGQELIEQVITAITSQTELAEKYSRATYEIGKLEATLDAVKADRDRFAGLITDGSAERERMARELADARAEIAQLKARPWWQWRIW